MKSILIFLFSILLFNSSQAQGDFALPQGQKQLNFGLPGYVGLDIAVIDEVTLGPKVQLGIFDSDNYLNVGFVSDFHFNGLLEIPSEWDVYAGLNAGFHFNIDGKGNDSFKLGGQLGGRYYWNSIWGFNLEFAFSGAIGGGVGVTMKM